MEQLGKSEKNRKDMFVQDTCVQCVLDVKEGVPIRNNVGHLGLCGHIMLDGLVFAAGKDGVGLYVIVSHDRLAEGTGFVMLIDREFMVRDLDHARLKLFLAAAKVDMMDVARKAGVAEKKSSMCYTTCIQ